MYENLRENKTFFFFLKLSGRAQMTQETKCTYLMKVRLYEKKKKNVEKNKM